MPEKSSSAVRILIVDDHEVVRLGLHAVLKNRPEIQVVGETDTAKGALELARQLKPDVVLLDVRLPDGSGLDVCRELSSQDGGPKVLILTSYGDEENIFAAIDSGAEAYLLKEASSQTLVQAILDVSAGKSILDPKVTRQLLRRIRQHAAPDPTADKLHALSSQERRVLALVAEGKTNKEIGAALSLSDKTVKNYLSNIFDKLQLTRRSQAAVFFMQAQSAR
jgi:two-component system, NarL family, response regulator DevR